METKKLSTNPSIKKLALYVTALFTLIGCSPEQEEKAVDNPTNITQKSGSKTTYVDNQGTEKGPKVSYPLFIQMGYDAYLRDNDKIIINDHTNHKSFLIPNDKLNNAKKIINYQIVKHVDENGGHDTAREEINKELRAISEEEVIYKNTTDSLINNIDSTRIAYEEK